VSAAVISIAGCRLDQDSLLFRHLSDDRRAEAKERWDGVRGEVKLQLVEQHIAAGRLDQAEKVLEQALAITPGNPEVYVLATRLRLEQGQLALARDAAATAAAMSVDSPEVEYLQGMIAERYGDLPQALGHYTAAACRAPNISAYVLAQAEILIALDRPAEALSVIEPRTDDFDGDPAVRMLAARCAQMLGLRGPAADHCREALRGPEDEALCAEAGLIMVWAEQYEEAIALLRPLVEKDLAQGGPNEAATWSSAAPPSNPTHEVAAAPSPQGPAPGPAGPAVIHGLARAYLASGQWRSAQWAAKIMMSRDEKDFVAWSIYARAALRAGDLEAASAVLAAMRQNQVVTAETLLLAAYVAFRRGDRTGAIEAAESALALDHGLATARRLIESAEELALKPDFSTTPGKHDEGEP
jgi:tetratricopeptide (TPR) repeat protein